MLSVALLCGCLTPSRPAEAGALAATAEQEPPGDPPPRCPPCQPEIRYVRITETRQDSPAIGNISDDSCVSLGCPPGTKFVGSKSASKYHACDCKFAAKLSAKNRVCYKSAEEAEAAGKQPCGLCAGEGAQEQ